jgi:hypothetical protein
MALDDLPLEHAESPPPPGMPPRPASSPVRWIVLGAAAVIVGAALVFWWLSRAQPGTVTPAATTATDVAVASNRPKRQNLDLPSLEASDSFLRPLVSALSKNPLLARLVATPELIRSATVAIVQIGDGKTPATPMKVLQPATHVAIAGNAATGHLDPATYARWDGHTAALVSIDPKELAQLYVNVKLLFDQAYGELGHPNGDFDEAIVKAINTLAETPRLEAEPTLIRKQPGFYEYEDQTMRALLPVQKQFLLMGPDNRRRVLAWLRELANDLDLKLD